MRNYCDIKKLIQEGTAVKGHLWQQACWSGHINMQYGIWWLNTLFYSLPKRSAIGTEHRALTANSVGINTTRDGKTYRINSDDNKRDSLWSIGCEMHVRAAHCPQRLHDMQLKWELRNYKNNNLIIFCWIFYVGSTLICFTYTFFISQRDKLPRISCWGSHFPDFTFGGCPGKMSDSHFHSIFCGNSEKASIKTRLFSSGIWSLRTLLPRLKYITPSLALSRNFWRSWKYITLTAFMCTLCQRL